VEFAAIALSLALSLMALAFTIGSFWWLHARKGSLEAARPRTYAFCSKPRLRLPFAFFNTGARALIVEDLRVVVEGHYPRPPLEWITTRTTLRPEPEDGHSFATPFAVQGRATREVIAEFGDEALWEPAAGHKYVLQLQARLHDEDAWTDVVTFEWWAPPTGAALGAYVTYRNEPPQIGT
jgi:hypothetical protein